VSVGFSGVGAGLATAAAARAGPIRFALFHASIVNASTPGDERENLHETLCTRASTRCSRCARNRGATLRRRQNRNRFRGFVDEC
jgi:hypothetical protein